jgi:hypothetical protein
MSIRILFFPILFEVFTLLFYGSRILASRAFSKVTPQAMAYLSRQTAILLGRFGGMATNSSFAIFRV